MPAGRHMTPLFDLLARSTSTRSAEMRSGGHVAPKPNKPVVRVELKPQEHAAPAPPAPEPMRHAATTQAHASGPSIRLPANALYITIAALILVGLVAWVGGVQWGKSKEAARAEKELAAFRDRPSPADPLAHETGTGRETKQNATALPPPKPAVDQNQGAQAPAAVTPRGLTGTDPREAGKNYLALVTTNAAEVQAAVTFLAANGIDAFAIPLESSGSGAKNQGPDGRYRLYALPGITPEQLKQNDSMKKSIESKIAQLAARWKKEYRGGSDFSSAQWMKYSGN